VIRNPSTCRRPMSTRKNVTSAARNERQPSAVSVPVLHQTVTAQGEPSDVVDRVTAYPRLTLVIEAERPLREPVCVPLVAHDCVYVRRSAVRELVSTPDGLVLGVADQEMSRQHVRLVRHGSRWELLDLGSKNGTFVNGATTAGHWLMDGDIIELGGTLLVYRNVVPDGADVARFESALRVVPRALWTAHLGLACALERLTRIAPSNVPVLIRGDSGTGKELIAWATHEMSARSGAFVAINCGALPRLLVES